MVEIAKPRRDILLNAFKNDTRSVKAIEELYDALETIQTADESKIFSFMVG